MNAATLVCALAMSVGIAASSFAQSVPAHIKRLESLSDDVAAERLARYGYQLTNEKKGWDRTSRFWWNGATRQCLQVASRKHVVVQVAAASPADCRIAEPGGGGSFGGGRDVNPLDLQGLPRSAAEARLNQAGFRAQNMDQSKPEVTYVWWFNGRQCLAVSIVGERYELVRNMPLSECR